MGMHELLQDQMLALERGEKIREPQGAMAGIEVPGKPGLTENFRMAGRAGRARWAIQQGGSGAQADEALDRCIEIMREQIDTVGFMGHEQTAGAPHFNYETYPVIDMRESALLMLAQKVHVERAALLESYTGAWGRHFRVLYDAVAGVNRADQTPLIWIPGARCEQEDAPKSQDADMFYRVLRGLKTPRWWKADSVDEKKFHCVRRLIRLLATGDRFGGEPTSLDRPRLALPMNVSRRGSRLLVWLDRPAFLAPGTQTPEGHQSRVGPFVEPCDWIDVDVASGQYTYGKFWNTPHPAPPAPARRFGG